MDKMQAVSFQPQTLNSRLFRRIAFSLLGMGLGYAALLHLTTASVLSQASAATIDADTPTETLLRPTLKLGSQGAEVTELQATLQLLGFYGGTVDGVYGQSTVSAVSQFQQAAGLNADGITGPATWNRLFPATAEAPSATLSAANRVPSPATNTTKTAPSNTSAASFPIPEGASPTPISNQPATKPRPAVKPAPSATPSKPAKATPAPSPAIATATPSTNTPVALPVLRQGMKGPAVAALQERLRSLGVFKGPSDGVFGAETLSAVKAAQRRLKLEPDGIVGGGTWNALLR